MQIIVQDCIDGCGRQRIFKCPDGFSPIPNYDHVAVAVESEQRRLTEIAKAVIARRLQLRNDLEALKANQPAWWTGVFG